MTMTSEEIEDLKRRFGDDVSAWPAPYRLLVLQNGHEEPIDRLVREAAVDGIDDGFLARKVLDGLDVGTGSRVRGFRTAFSSPRLVAGAALMLTGAAMAGGYQFAGAEGRSIEASLFAVAAGAPTTLLLDDELDIPESRI